MIAVSTLSPGPSRLRRPRRRAGVAAIWLALGAATGCSFTDDGSAGDDEAAVGCTDTVHEAAFATEVDEVVDLLDEAFTVCPSYDALTAAMARYPDLIGYDLPTFVQLRCSEADDPAIVGSAACRPYVAPPTTPPPVDTGVVYVGETLDGRVIELRPDADTRFVGDLPEIVQQTVDIAIEAGCEGVITQRDTWAARVGDPEIGDEASVYANHAQNVANYIGCDVAPLPTAPAT